MEETKKEIIVRMPNWLGDCIMTIPALKALSKNYSLILLGKKWLQEIFRGQEFYKKIIPYKGLFKKCPRIEIGLLFTNSFSSAFHFFLCGIKRRIGYSTDIRSFLLTDRIPPRKNLHQVLQYNYLARYLVGEFHEEMKLRISQEEKEYDVIILPGASKQAKRWGEKKFRKLGESLVKDNFSVLYVGAKFEEELLKRASGKMEYSIPSLGELPAILSRARLVVGNDTGPIHIAAAVGTKVLPIFGPTDPKLTAPWGQKNSYIYKNPPCGPCHRKTCPEKKHICMNQIKVEEVRKKILDALKT